MRGPSAHPPSPFSFWGHFLPSLPSKGRLGIKGDGIGVSLLECFAARRVRRWWMGLNMGETRTRRISASSHSKTASPVCTGTGGAAARVAGPDMLSQESRFLSADRCSRLKTASLSLSSQDSSQWQPLPLSMTKALVIWVAKLFSLCLLNSY